MHIASYFLAMMLSRGSKRHCVFNASCFVVDCWASLCVFVGAAETLVVRGMFFSVMQEVIAVRAADLLTGAYNIFFRADAF